MPRHSRLITPPQGVLYKIGWGSTHRNERHYMPSAILRCSIPPFLLKDMTHFSLKVGVLSFLIFLEVVYQEP